MSFGSALQMSFDGAGNLVLLDPFNKWVVVVGPDGRLVRVVGRAGEGPGEFQQVRVLAVWRDDRFAVPDTEHSAVVGHQPGGLAEGGRVAGTSVLRAGIPPGHLARRHHRVLRLVSLRDCGFSDVARIRGTTTGRLMCSAPIVSTWARCRRGRLGCRWRSGRVGWWCTWSATSWMCRRWW